MTNIALSFNDVKFSPIERDNQIWLTGSELATALGYSRVDSLNKIYDRNADEFNTNMTQNVILTLSNKNNELQEAKTRIFSLRGCHLIAMFARTAIAKDFRKWVLDVLDKEVGNPVIEEPKITIEQQQAIKDAVLRKAERDKRTYQSVYREFYNTFDIPRYQELPLSRFDEALNWLSDGWYRNKAQTTALHNTKIIALAHHMKWVSAWWNCYGEAIQLLNPKMAGRINDHFSDGAFTASLVLGSAESRTLNHTILNVYPFDMRIGDRVDFFRQR